MPASRTQLIGGNFQDSEGNVLALGYLKMRLNQDEEITGVGQIAAGIVVQINLNSSGSVDTSTPQYVWANDVMTPVNSFYVVTGYAANGELAWGPNNQQVTSGGVGGGTFDVGTWIPNTVISWTYPAAFGPTGPTGAGGTGSVGPTGPAGATGATGSKGATGVFSGVGPRPGTANWRLWSSSGSGSANFGSESVGCVPNAQANAFAVVNPTSTQPAMINLACSTGAGGSQVIFGDNRAGTAQRNYTLGIMTVYQVKAALTSISSSFVRFWIIGNDHANNTEGLLVANNPAVNGLGFRFAPAAGDVNFQAYVCTDATHFTIVDTGVVADTNPHLFEAKATASGATIVFSIDGNQVASISTNVPTTSVLLGTTVSLDNLGTTGPATVSLAYSYLETSS